MTFEDVPPREPDTSTEAPVDDPTPETVAEAGGDRQHRVREVDFRRPSKFAREHVRRLEHAHENFCRTASSRLSAELGTPLELTVDYSDQLRYGSAMAELAPHSFAAVLDVGDLEAQIALVLDVGLALRLVDRLLGGGEPRTVTKPGMTDVEHAIARRAVASLVEPLSATWQDLGADNLQIASTATSLLNVQLVSASDPTLLLHMEASIDGITAPVTLVLPHSSVEPIVDGLERTQFGNAPGDDAVTAAVEAAVNGVEVDVRAEVGAVELTLAQLRELHVGQVLPLRRPVSAGVVLRAGDVPAYVAAPGRNGNSRAVQIQAPWSTS
jgi:flagellar motor switch protein FliM